MGCIKVCNYCYCCLKSLKPSVIEIIILICNLIGIGSIILVILSTPFDDIQVSGQIGIVFSTLFIFISFIFLIVIMCLRCGNNTINTSNNNMGKCFGITLIVFDILIIIFITIAGGVILKNINEVIKNKYYDDEEYYKKFSYSKRVCIYISISVFIIALAIHLYFLSLLIILIYAKTNLSYSKYLEANKGNINAPNSMDITADTQNNLNIHEYNQKPQYITANQISQKPNENK